MFVCALHLYPAIPGPGVQCWCLCSGVSCSPQFLAGVFGCVCLCARFACTLPILARVCGACVWVRVLLSPRQSWLGCWGVCLCGRCPPLPRQSWLGCGVWVCVLWFGFWPRPAIPGWGVGVSVFVCVLCLWPTIPGWDLWCVGWVLPGTCSRTMVRWVSCALSGFAAPGGGCCLAPVCVPWLWPAACLCGVPHGPAWCAAPRPVRSLSVLWMAFLTPWCLCPSQGLASPDMLGGWRGRWRLTENRPHSSCRWPLASHGR